MPTKLVVQIPTFNEEATICQVIINIPRKIKGIDAVKVLVADDYSSDSTIHNAKVSGADHIIRNNANQGLGKNFKRAIEHSLSLGADIIVNIDGDGQFNPKDIPQLIKPILQGEADMVTCTRFLQPELTKDIPWVKKAGNWGFTKLINILTRRNFTDTQCGFRAYSREAAMRLNLKGSFSYTQEVFISLVEKDMRIVEIPLEVTYFKERKSHISGNLRRYGFRSLGIIIRTFRDNQPLLFFGVPGILSLFLGGVGSGYSIYYYITHLSTSAIRTLLNISISAVVIGLVLITVGLLADMLLTLKMNQEEMLYRMKGGETQYARH